MINSASALQAEQPPSTNIFGQAIETELQKAFKPQLAPKSDTPPLIDVVEAGLRKRGAMPTDRSTFAHEIALLRRGILAADMLLCAGLGYWIGLKIGG